MEKSQRPETESSESFLAGERQGLERAAQVARKKAANWSRMIDAPFSNSSHYSGLADGAMRVRTAIESLLPTGREAAWQSIETAPKDGTEILSIAWFSEIDDWWYAHVKWFLDDWRFCNDGDCSIARPTCWQPLPPPPTTLKQVGAWGDGEQKEEYGNEQVYCTHCCAITAPDSDKASAAAWWNNRGTQPSFIKAIEADIDHLARRAAITIPKWCECVCHGLHEVRSETCVHCIAARRSPDVVGEAAIRVLLAHVLSCSGSPDDCEHCKEAADEATR